MTRPTTLLCTSLLCACLLPSPARAIDGANIGMMATEEPAGAESTAPTYYEGVVQTEGSESLESTDPELPSSLAIHDSTARASYVEGSRAGSWTLRIRDLVRPHERVDAVYQMIAVLPLPFDADGQPAFETHQLGITVREGTASSSRPLTYGGEKVVLKRNVALEKILLPGLIGDFQADKLPPLAGTGYDYTLWDAIVRYDPSHGDTMQLLADLRYTTGGGLPAPDAGDERLKAYVLTWIPAMDPRQPVFSVRIDVEDALD